MSLATRCNSCGTAFRVVQDQLKVSEGWVRCGRCDAVFNALEGLFDLGRDAPAEWQERVDPVVASLAPAPAEWSSLPAPPDEADEADHEHAAVEAPAAKYESSAGDDEAPTSNLGELLADPIDARLFGPRKRAESAPKPAGQLGAMDRVEFSDARFDSDLFLENTSVPNAQTLVMPSHEESDLPPEGQARPEFVRRAERRARWQSAPMRAALGVASALAALVLAAQAANHYRDTVAAEWPALRPVLVAWCRIAQCRIEAPRRIDDLMVESTALTRAPVPDAFVLSVTLRNRSPIALMLPSIDLTLTDANGRPVARRVLAPHDFRAAEVIAPRAEAGLQALLSTGTSSVVGYTVEIFYP
jgi:predicted Zn finger-like uncharacterized protein